MNRQNTAYKFANFFTLEILKEGKDGRAGVFLYNFFWLFSYSWNSLLGMIFLTEDLSVLTHNCSIAHAGSPRVYPSVLDPEANFGTSRRANN